jgi:hypothetical protein
MHQQYVVPALPASAQVFHWGASSLVEERIAPFMNLFSPPLPPFSYKIAPTSSLDGTGVSTGSGRSAPAASAGNEL